MKKDYTYILAAILVFMCSGFSSLAQIPGSIAYYIGGSGVTTTTTGGPNLVANPLQAVGFGSGVTCTTGGLSGLTVNPSWTAYSPSGPHVFFKVTPNPGYELNISSFQTDCRKQTGGPSYAVNAYSLDNGATWLTDGGHTPGALSCAISTVCTWSGGTFPITVTDVTNGIILAVFPYGSTDSTIPWQINEIYLYGSVNCITPQITTHSIINHPDTVCEAVDFNIQSCGDTALSLQVATFFGDGSTNTTLLGSGTTTGCSADVYHTYALPGTYLVKQVLYAGAAAVDSITFSYENLNCSTFPVKFYYDVDSNCVFDASDIRFFDPITMEVDSSGIAVDTISCAGGFYYKETGAPIGTIYGFKMISLPVGIAPGCSAPSGIFYDTVTSIINDYPVKYVGVKCAGGSAFDLSVNATIPITGHMDQSGNIYVRNTSCTPVDATVTMQFSPKYVFSYGTPAPASIVGNTVTWVIPGIDATNSMVPVHLSYLVWYNPATGLLTYGDTVNTRITVTPTTGDVDSLNNFVNIMDTVRASCDPNAMWVSPQDTIVAGKRLQYVINFENTGNDTAHDVYLLDTLSDKLDHNSIEIVSASAELNTMLIKSGGYNIMKFDFPGINLLDSTHHGLCDGSVTFNLNTLQGLPNGTVIPNSAGIYFDDNGVVMTNRVQNIIGLPTTRVTPVSNASKFSIYPNPANTQLNIAATDNITAVAISNLLGQTVYSNQYYAHKVQVDVTGLPTGVYFVKINGTEVRKFVKE